jgi:UDP-2,3-diacylglucosamine pyrophosphatase LpxH
MPDVGVLVDGELTFDEVHVVSDLHLGGAPGRQIFAGSAELSELIWVLQARPPERRVALVINGDFIDFLAIEPALHFDPVGACAKLDRVAADPTFVPIWAALRAFVGTANRRLVIVLGNHDIELALPSVSRHLVESLAEGNDASRGRITLSAQGHGFAARVNGKRIVCVHGNEADTWNIIDFDRLRRIGTELQLRGTTDAWTPNAGTMLVIDVMNEIKQQFPFVDLLKPETQAVIPILWALDQGTSRRLGRCLRVARRLSRDKVRRMTGLLTAEDEEQESPDALRALLSGPSSVTPARSAIASADLAIERAMERLHEDPVSRSNLQGELGVVGAIWERLTSRNPMTVALEALESLNENHAFSRSTSDATFEQLDEMVGDADFVIAGHTHLERDLARRRRFGRYFNTGTWARLIKIRPEWVASAQRFTPVWQALRQPTLAALDGAQIEGSNLVTRRHTVASISHTDGTVTAALRRARLVSGRLELLEPTVSEE